MTFLDHYLRFSESNEAPRVFHQWAGLSALSHLIASRVWTHMGGFLTFYPNLFVNLVGEPGIMKTTAMNQASELVSEIPQIKKCPTGVSKEALAELMAKEQSPCLRSYKATIDGKEQIIAYSQIAIFASEIVSLLNASGNPLGMIEFFTDIWDRCGRVYELLFKNKGNNIILRPYISILACLTPDTLKALVNSKIISSGMSRRCLFITAESNGDPIPFINVTEDQMKSWEVCKDHAKNLQNVWGQFTWDEDAHEFYQKWYTPFKVNITNVESGILKRFYMSKAEYVIKVSMLLSIAEIPPRLSHSLENFKEALRLVTSVENGACQLFDQSGRNELATISSDVEKFIQAQKSVRINQLYSRFWKDLKDGNTAEIDKIVSHLVRQGKVTTALVTENGSTVNRVSWKDGGS